MNGRTRFVSHRYCGSKTSISPNFVCQQSFFYLGDASQVVDEFLFPSLRPRSRPSLVSPPAPKAAFPRQSALRSRPAILKVAVGADFGDSQIIRKMIHHMDEALAVPSGGFESRLRRFSGSPEGARRQYRHGGFRLVGLRDVFHAERFFPFLSTCSGERPGPFKLPEPVRHREGPVRNVVGIGSGIISDKIIIPYYAARSNC